MCKSTIFKTITDDVTKSGKAITFLGKKVSNIISDLKNHKGIVTSIFGNGKSNQLSTDIKAMQQLFNYVDDGMKVSQAYKKMYAEMSDTARSYVKEGIRAGKTSNEIITSFSNLNKKSSLAAKGIGLLKTALNSIAYMAIIQLISTLANTIITKFDDIVNAYQNGIDKLKDLSSEIKGLESEQSSLNSELKESQERLYELQQIKMPTLFEKDEIENLKEYNKQLEMQIRLKQLEIEQTKQEANKTAQDTFKSSQIDNNHLDDAFNEDFEWWEHILNVVTGTGYSVVRNGLQNTTNWFQGNTWDQQMDYLKDAEFWLEKYNEVVEYAKTVDDENVYNNLLVNQDYKKGKLDEYITDLSKRYQEWYTELLGLDPYDKANEERIKQLNDAMARAEKVLNYESAAKNFTDVYGDAQFSEITTKLEALAKAGELTEDTFNSVEGIDRFKAALEGIGTEGVSVEEAVRAINKQIQEESKYANNTAGSIQNLSEAFEKLYDAIDSVLSKQEKLADAFKKTRLGAKLTIQELYELIKEMPSLAPYVSKEDDGYTISAEGFEAVSKENDNTVKEQIAKDLETTRENIALLEKEQELLAEKDKLYQQWENTGGANKNLKNQYDEVAAEYEDVAGQCQNITGSIEELTEYEKSLVIINDLVGESFNEMSLIVEGVNEAFDKAKTEISGYNSNIQTIDNAIKTLKDSSLLTYDEMNALVDIAPELQDSFEQQEEGYSIVIDALEELREESYKTRNEYIDDKIAETKAEIEATEKFKQSIKDKIAEINNLGKSAVLANADYIASLNGEMSDVDEKFKSLYDTIEKLEGLRGDITVNDDGSNDDLSDKLQNQIDYYKTILSAVDAVQNKYSEAIDREISALEDSKKALRDSNDERQRELDLIDARNNLENAKKRKIWVYNEGEGFKQVANEKAVKEAEEELRNVVVNIQEAEIDKRIEALEDQKEQLEENTKALVDLESEIEDAKNIAQAVNALGLSDESELLTLPDDTVEEIRNGLTEATLQKDIEDNKGNDDYVIVSMDEILQRLGAKVNAEEAFRILRGEDSQRMAYEAATKNYADALNGQFDSTVLNTVNNSNPNTVTFNIYDATDPNKVARVVNQELTTLFTKIGNSIK